PSPPGNTAIRWWSTFTARRGGCRLLWRTPLRSDKEAVMKRLIFIGGAMGVGKTATARALQNRLQPAAMLDGDWCWDIRPFTVNDGTKEMVQQNITFLLRQFLHSPACETVIFSWVMDHREIAEELLRRIGAETLRE